MYWNNLRGSAIKKKNQLDKYDFKTINININIVVQKELERYNIKKPRKKNKYGEWIIK
tara:strand:+ start:1571 stop:1744 length:174 start_codon:yes stop_codon:yes gene_type:complete